MLHRSKFHVVAIGVLALWTVLAVFGCESKSTADTGSAPSETVISIAATPTSVSTNETSIVEATVSAGGTGVVGQVVHFTVTPSSAGSVTPEYDTTLSDGVAATVFTASADGAAVVRAEVVGGSLSSSVGLSVTGSTDQTGTGDINLSASRSLLLANGSDTSVVTIVVRDELGQAAPDGTLLKIVAGEKFVDVDGNGYWSANIDSLVYDANGNGDWDSYGLIPSTTTTSGGVGQATVNYVSGDQAFTVYIKVTVDDGGIQGSAELSMQLSPNTVLHSIYLASDSVSLSVESTGGIETSFLRAVGYDINGNPVPEGMAIVFAILDGPGGGEHLDTVGYGPDTAYTNGQGVATTTISSGTVAGTVRTRAYSGTVLSNATQVLVAAGPPYTIVVGSAECNVPYWDNVADSVGIVAVVSDIYHNPVNDSTVVYFTTDEGTVMSHQARTMYGKGIATSAWLAGTSSPTADGIVVITAETAGGTVTDATSFIDSHVPATVWIVAGDSTLLADGVDKLYVNVETRDLNNNYVVDGTKYEVEAGYLGVADGAFGDGCYSSNDRVQITSVTLEKDHSTTGGNDDGIGAIDNVTFIADGGASASIAITLVTGPAHSGSSSIDGPSSAQPGEQLRFTVTVVDRNGNPLGDHTLSMTAADGVVTGGTQETNEYGEAVGFLWTAPALDGDYNIVVTDTDPRGSGMVLTHKVTVKAAT